MNVLDLLSRLRQANIQISLVGDKLKIKAPQGAITPEIKQQLTDAKQDIIDFLAEAASGSSNPVSIPTISRQGEMPLSYTQSALWTMDKINPGSIAYNLPMAFKFFGSLDVQLLEAAIQHILVRHESLRLRVEENDNGDPVACFDQVKTYCIPVHNLKIESVDLYDNQIKMAVDHYALKPFDLADGPLYRFDLISVSGEVEPHSILIICLHHIISDGLSQNLLVREIALLYASFLQGHDSPLPELPIQYVDFAAWQKQQLSGEKLDKEITFWKQQLAGVPPLLALPTDRPRPIIQTTHGAKYHFDIPSSASVALIQYCKAEGYTVFMGLMAALQVVLARHAQQTDFCLGMPTAGRHYKEVEQLIGFFVNGVLVRANLQGNPSWSTHLDNVKQRLLDVLSHQETPAQLIVDHLNVSRNPSYPPLAQVGFQLQNFSGSVQDGAQEQVMLNTFNSMTNLTMEPLKMEEADSKFDMIVSVAQQDESLSGYVEYNTDLFDQSTIAKLVDHFVVCITNMVSEPYLRVEAVQLDDVEAISEYLELVEGEKLVRLTTTQQAFVQDIQLRPETKQYAVGFKYKINATLDYVLLKQAIHYVIEQHDLLRARFISCDLPWADQAYQVIQPQKNVPIEQLDISDKTDLDRFVDQHFDRWCYVSHDIFRDELTRFQIIVGGDANWLLLSCHHIVLDGMSGMSLLQKISDCYSGLVERAVLPIYKDSFIHYVDYHHQMVDEQKTVEFWREKSKTVAPLSYSLPHAWHDDDRYQIQSHPIAAELLKDIQSFCRKHKTHPSIFYRLVAALMIKQYCRPDADFVMWDIQSGRRSDDEQSIGVFYQQVPYIIPLDVISGSQTCDVFFAHQRQFRRDIKGHNFVSLQNLNRLFPAGTVNVQFNYFNFLQPVEMAGSSNLPYTFSSHVDGTVQIFVKDYGSALSFELWFDGAVFVPQDFLPRFESVVRQITSNPSLAFSSIVYDTDDECQKQVMWNQVGLDSQSASSVQERYGNIVEWFEKSAQSNLDQIALLCGADAITYGDLNNRTNQLSHFLINAGVGKGDRVGVCLGRSHRMILSVLSVVKCGAVYVPIEASYPKDRIDYILNDCGATLLISERCLEDTVSGFEKSVLYIDDVEGQLATLPNHSVNVQLEPNDPIYAIYTSGSTGKPKGALVTHGGELNLQQWYTSLCGFGVNDRTLIVSAFGFDLTQKNLFAPLLCGGAVIIPEMSEFDAEIVTQAIMVNHVTHINCAPSAFYMMVDECDEQIAKQLASLRWVFLGGEAIRLSVMDAWLQHPLNQAQVVNSYGPTECTDVVSYHVLSNTLSENKIIPIGKPIQNTQIHILNDDLGHVPFGVIGEICISGSGVGLGYIDREELTRSVFVDAAVCQGPLYRTGDLGRYLPDGSVEYIGRKDFQVKVRGLRIELGEVESAINQLPEIVDSVVVVMDDTLIGYALSPKNQLPQTWQADLSKMLPVYMVPSHLIVLDQWPLTPNGKVDRKALPKPDVTQRAVAYIEPRNDVESHIASVWAQVLGVEKVGVEDSFFDLGGHSLLANQIVTRIRKHFEIDFPIRNLIVYPTISQLAQRVVLAQKSKSLSAIEVVSRHSRIPLSASQQRMWLLDKIEPGNAAYHVPSIVRVKGALDVAHLTNAFSTIINRHEGLRAFFIEDEQGPHQQFLGTGQWGIDVSSVAEGDIKQKVGAYLTRPFTLESGPLFRAAIYKISDSEMLLVVVLHHIVTDGWSNGILVKELGEAYIQFASHQPISMQELPFQYADYAAWQYAQLSENLTQKIAYWKSSLGDVPALELPLDFKRPSVQTFNGASVNFRLSITAANSMNQLVKKYNTTHFMLLLSAYGALLQRYSGQEAFAIGTPVAGRDRPELEGVVGFFVNTIAIMLSPDVTQSFSQLLENVKETVLSGFEHQDIPFEDIVEEINPTRDMSRSPIFQVMMVYQNIPVGSESVPTATLGDVTLEPYDVDINTAKFEQTLTLWPHNNTVSGSLTYNTDLFTAETVQQFVDHFIRVCDIAFSQPDLALYELDVLTDAEKHQQLTSWNQTHRDYEHNIRVEELVSRAAVNYKDSVAISCGDQTISYSTLMSESDIVAKSLLEKGITKGSFVGILLDRNIQLMSAILGTLKSGAVYIPIDASYPQGRIEYICEQSNINVVVSARHLTSNLPENIDCLYLEEAGLHRVEEQNSCSIIPASEEDLLYVIYTSGSTGNPKATGAYHRSELNLLEWYTHQFDMTSSDRVLLLSAIGFDLTQKNLFAPLTRGAQLIVPSFQEFDPNKLVDLIESKAVTWINCAPSAFYPLIDNPDDWHRLTSLRYVFLGGEPINMSRLSQWLDQSNCQLVNSYGPTECADIASWHIVDVKQDADSSIVPIGKPNYNVELFVCGEHQELLPRGAVGELCIGGDGVGPGYLNAPELTAQVFIDNPYRGNRIMYRTGDRVRYRSDGSILYLGRKDHQIKLRGYRVEAGEIQSVINKCAAVKESLVDVVKTPSGIDQLVAWVVITSDATKAEEVMHELKASSHDSLPQFMVPDFWMVVEDFKLTANGKIDKASLPKPEWGERSVAFVAPRNALEVGLAEIWAEVLHLEAVGVHDNFFELGGHSLLATQVAARVRSRLGYVLPIKDIMATPTIDAIASRVSMKRDADNTVPLMSVSRDQRLPLSFAQQRLWLLDKIEPGSVAYNVPTVLRIKGTINVSTLEKAMAFVFNRHEGLRTFFDEDEHGPYQAFHSERDWVLSFEDIRQGQSSKLNEFIESELKRKVAIELMTPFALDSGPLFRTKLFRIDENEHVFSVVIHHVVTDGWSMNVLVQDLVSAYIQLDKHNEAYFQPMPIQYADFSVWQRQRLNHQKQEQLLEYWRVQLAGVEPLVLPTDFRRPPIQTYNGNTLRFSIPASTKRKLHAISIDNNTSLFASLMSGFAILLKNYSGQYDFCIGTPVAGREQSELENVVGFFVNTLAIRAQLQVGNSFVSVLEQVKNTLLDGYTHQEMPFEQIVEEIDPARDMSRSPVFQVMLAYQNLPVDQQRSMGADQFGDLNIEPYDPGVDSSKYEMTLTLWDAEDGLGASLQYNTDLFSERSIHSLAKNFVSLLESLSDAPDQTVSEQRYLTEQDVDTQLVEWNLTGRDYDRTVTVHESISRAAPAFANNKAVICGDAVLTYAELDAISNQFAHYLIASGVAPADNIAICVDRNLHLMSMLLGILKAGATYVPIDASYPESRIAYILQSASIDLVVTQRHLVNVLPSSARSLIWDQVIHGLADFPADNPNVHVDSDQLLYLIFTSGSTGNPKGTGAHHHSEINLLTWYCNEFNLAESDRVLLLSAFGFDLTQKNLFAPLLRGGTLVIPSFQEFDGGKITRLISKENITWLNCAPSAFYVLQDEISDWSHLQSLRLLFLGGEPINLTRMESWLRQSNCQLINSYGPTECTDIAAWYAVDINRDILAATLPIGKPNYNVQLYILGNESELLPIGAIGELCIGGAGVGPGYINDIEQTQAVFINDRFTGSGTLYRTGDRARYREDGNIEYLGRRDNQIKLRGYRIESGEIQSVLNKISNVKDSLVDVVKNDAGVQKLVAWVLSDTAEESLSSKLEQACREFLPFFMVPDQWVLLDEFPLTPNGKIDRKALPKPAQSELLQYKEPVTEIEINFSREWAKVLGVERVGLTDDFFSLGGQSLLATQLVNKLSRTIGKQISVRGLFENPTIETLLAHINEQSHRAQRPPIKPRPNKERAPLSFGQQRLWFFEQMNPGSPANNMPIAIKIKGIVDFNVLQQAFIELIRRHDALRTCFVADEEGTPHQLISPTSDFGLGHVNLSNMTLSEADQQLAEIIQDNNLEPIALNVAPLLRAKLVDLSSQDSSNHCLVLCVHHIISDGASQVILFRELMTLYLAFLTQQPSPLTELSIQYPDYSHWQRQWLNEATLSSQLTYWKQKLAHAPSLLDLPLDKPRPKVQSTRGGTVNLSFDSELTARIRTLCTEQAVTPFMFTLLVWKTLLHRFSGQNDIVVGVPTLGRHTPELDNVIGFFIQSLVLRSQFDSNPSMAGALQDLKTTVLDGFAHGDVPVDKIVEHLGIARNPAYSPLVQVAFQLLDGAALNAGELVKHAQFGDMEVEVLSSQTASAKFDLTLNLTLDGNDLAASLEYNADLFEEKTAKILLSHYQFICESVVSDLQQPINKVEYLSQNNLFDELDLRADRYEDVIALSSMQYDMFMDNLVNPESLQSSHGWNIHIHRRLDLSFWKRSVQALVSQQPMLRAKFVTGDKPYMDMGYLAILKEKQVDVELIDLSDSSADLSTVVNRLIYKPYDVVNDELIRFHVIQLAIDHFVVVTAVHHALLDGAALNVLWVQLTDTYNKLVENSDHSVAVIPFKEFVKRDRYVMDTAPVLHFWREKLFKVEPLDFTVPISSFASPHSGFVTKELFLDDAHWSQIKSFCRKQRITPSLYFKCLYGYLIGQYCRSDSDFSIQETMGGRIKGHQEGLGCYIQEIPFVFDENVLTSSKAFVDVLEYARQYQKEIKDQRQISIGKQIEISPRGRIGFMYNFYQFLGSMEFLGETINPEGTPSDPAHNIQFVVTEVAGQLKLNLFYHPHLFADFGMLDRINSLSCQILMKPGIRLSELHLVSDESERMRLVELWNNTQSKFDLSLCLHQKFEQKALQIPHMPAIIDDHTVYSYLELNTRANQLSHFLVEKGAKHGDLIGLCADRSANFLVGILGIMKAGGAYVPMDPKYPDDRIDYMIKNSEVSILITQQDLLEKTASAKDITRVCLDSDWVGVARYSHLNLNLPITPRDRAYMIYTSGSTGLPKGAIIRHDGALNHIEAECQALEFNGEFSFLQTAPSSSDISVWQFIGPVIRGGKVVVLDDVTHAEKLFTLVKQHQIDVVELVPVALQLLMEYVRQLSETDRQLPCLRWMMATGEAVSVDLVNDWLALYPEIPVVNAYGPTEAADDVIQCAISKPIPATQKSVPIGKPLANLSVYIVDDLLRLVPAGVPGEICIGGIGVGEGYWNNPEKTVQAFVRNPFVDEPGATMYRTGDLGRWLGDGSIEYLDRVDNQVKVRGFRIELGEVEAALSALAGVRENVVIVRDDMPGGKALAAYVVAAEPQLGLDAANLRAQLRESLPDFMVPAAITVLEALPLTPAGKIDRKSLPRPISLQIAGNDYVAPTNPVEETLVNIWESLMPLERIGITDNFFEIGGHSLIGVRIIAKVNKAFSTQLQVSALLTTQTIEKLARLISSDVDDKSIVVTIYDNGKPPLFMVHPVGGDVLCYADLARTLSEKYAIYGIRSKGLDGTTPPYQSFDEMLKDYLDGIFQHQTHGPYRLLGQSIGGILCHALAGKLESMGHEVADVIMLDTYSPRHLKSANSSASEILGSALGVSLTDSSTADLSQAPEADTDSYITKLYQMGQQSGIVPNDLTIQLFSALYRVSIQNHTFASQYEVENITANVHHFTAADNVTGVNSGASWAGILNLDSINVPGGHESMMQGSNAPELADRILLRLGQDNNNNE